MKAQVQPISLVLVAGIIISLVSTAYFTGVPLIEKRIVISDYEAGKKFMYDLSENIVDLVNKGSGKIEIAVPKGKLYVVPYDADDPDNNSIVLLVSASHAVALNNTIPLMTNSMAEQDIYGEAKPRIITLDVQEAGVGYTMKFKMHFRELYTTTNPLRGYLIVADNEFRSTEGVFTVKFDGTTVVPNGAANMGDLYLSHIQIGSF